MPTGGYIQTGKYVHYVKRILLSWLHRAYCKYHYLEGHEYKTSEAELLHFLEKIDNSTVNNTLNFKWQLQYEAYGNPDEEENLNLSKISVIVTAHVEGERF